MFDLLSKYVIFFLIVLGFTSCVSNWQVLECQNRNNKFRVRIPNSKGSEFHYLGDSENGNLLFYENTIDSIEIRISSNFINPSFNDLFEIENYKRHYDEESLNKAYYEIMLEQKLRNDYVLKRYLYFSRVENHPLFKPHYEVTYVVAEFTEKYNIRLNIIKRYSNLDLRGVLSWINAYKDISIRDP